MVTVHELKHWFAVAWGAGWPSSQAFWVGLFHDTVEDGYLPKGLLRLWPALDAVTRRDGEPYPDFIARGALHPVGRIVKLADLRNNLSRNGGPPREELRQRYLSAVTVLEQS